MKRPGRNREGVERYERIAGAFCAHQNRTIFQKASHVQKEEDYPLDHHRGAGNNKKENEQSMADSMFHSVYQTAEQDGVYVKPAGNGKYKIYNSNGSFEKDFTGNAHLALSPNKKEHTYYFENGILDTTKEVTVVKVNGEDFYHYHGQLIESDAMELHGNLYWVYGGQIQYDKSGDFRISESDNTVYKVIKGKIVGYYESDGTLVGPGE